MVQEGYPPPKPHRRSVGPVFYVVEAVMVIRVLVPPQTVPVENCTTLAAYKQKRTGFVDS